MFGSLHYSSDEYYSMCFHDMQTALEGWQDEQVLQMNSLRHQMWAMLAPWSKGLTPKKLMPLPTDSQSVEPAMTKEEFLKLAAMMAGSTKAKA